jgi:hypothetical protein
LVVCAISYLEVYGFSAAPDELRPWGCWPWKLNMICLTLLAVLIGHGITGQWRGVLIDQENRITLSRVQLLFWTIVILSAILAAGVRNLSLGAKNPISIKIPTEVWALMGISTASLASASLVSATKKGQPATAEELERARAAAPEAAEPLNSGRLFRKPTPNEASWSDLFRGDEIGNFEYLDLGKIQLFYVTLIVGLCYGFALDTMFTQAGPITAFPSIDGGLVTMLGISHAGFLANKAVPHRT